MKRYLLMGLLSVVGITFIKANIMHDSKGNIIDVRASESFLQIDLLDNDEHESLNDQLFVAAKAGNLEKVKKLLKQGADASYQKLEFPGWYPSVLSQADSKVVGVLIAAGANIRSHGGLRSNLSVFATRLNLTNSSCRRGSCFYSPEECNAQKEALRLFLQSEFFKDGLSPKEQQEEIVNVIKDYNLCLYNTEENRTVLHQIVSEICDEQVAQAVYETTLE